LAETRREPFGNKGVEAGEHCSYFSEAGRGC
jgi:hypothetical protein